MGGLTRGGLFFLFLFFFLNFEFFFEREIVLGGFCWEWGFWWIEGGGGECV